MHAVIGRCDGCGRQALLVRHGDGRDLCVGCALRYAGERPPPAPVSRLSPYSLWLGFVSFAGLYAAACVVRWLVGVRW